MPTISNLTSSIAPAACSILNYTTASAQATSSNDSGPLEAVGTASNVSGIISMAALMLHALHYLQPLTPSARLDSARQLLDEIDEIILTSLRQEDPNVLQHVVESRNILSLENLDAQYER